MSAELNYFVLLDWKSLDLNPQRLEERINAKQKEWNLRQNADQKAREALALLKSMRELLVARPSGREADLQAMVTEARDYFGRMRRQDEDKIRQFARIHIEQYITPGALNELVASCPTLTKDEIEKILGLPIREAPATSTRSGMENSVYRVIKEDLTTVAKRDLYQLLDIESTPWTELKRKKALDRAAELQQDSRKRNPTKTNPVLNAAGRLAGHCSSVFANEDSRQQYESSRRLEVMESIVRPALELFRKAGNTLLAPEAYDHLLKQALEKGAERSVAEFYIREFSAKHKIALQIPLKLSVDLLTECGFCGHYNKPSASHCSCGRPLSVSCPVCKTGNASTSVICGNCGFNIGDLPEVDRLVREGERLHARGESDAEQRIWREVLVYWKDHPMASARLQEAKTRAQEAESRRGAVEQLEKAAREHIARRHFYAAGASFAKLRNELPHHPSLSLEADVRMKLQWATERIAAARRESDPEKAVALALAVWRDVEDCEAAREIMDRNPPRPPLSLKARLLPTSVELVWVASSSPGVTGYQIVRNETRRPIHPSDGETVGIVTGLEFQDTGIPLGRTLHYAVFSQRGNTTSPLGALSDALFATTEVEELRLIAGDGSIQLRWRPPVNAREIQVFSRRGSPPRDAKEGIEIRTTGLVSALHTGLPNGEPRGYLVVSVFHDSAGRRILSKGATIAGCAEIAPQPVSDLRGNVVGGALHLTWTQPPRGAVSLVFSSSPPSWVPGTCLPAQDASGGKAILANRPGEAVLPLESKGTQYVTPLTVVGDVAVPGSPVKFSMLKGPTEPSCEKSPAGLRLKWNWPAGATTAHILLRHDRYPASPQEVGAIVHSVSRMHYDNEGGWLMRQPKAEDHFFAVYIVEGASGSPEYSAPAQLKVKLTPVREIRYEVKNKGAFFGFGANKTVEVRLLSNNGPLEFPALVLVGRNRPVTNFTSGQIIGRIKASTSPRSSLKAEFDLSDSRAPLCVRLFLADHCDAEEIRLIAPPEAQLRVFT